MKNVKIFTNTECFGSRELLSLDKRAQGYYYHHKSMAKAPCQQGSRHCKDHYLINTCLLPLLLICCHLHTLCAHTLPFPLHTSEAAVITERPLLDSKLWQSGKSVGQELHLLWRSHPCPAQITANSTLHLHFHLTRGLWKGNLDEGQTTGASMHSGI